MNGLSTSKWFIGWKSVWVQHDDSCTEKLISSLQDSMRAPENPKIFKGIPFLLLVQAGEKSTMMRIYYWSYNWRNLQGIGWYLTARLRCYSQYNKCLAFGYMSYSLNYLRRVVICHLTKAQIWIAFASLI